MKKTLDMFGVGNVVNAHPKNGDFDHTFTGIVIGHKQGFVQVRDQDGDVFDCEPDQLSFNTDDIMHENA